jgi:hypothetical protein
MLVGTKKKINEFSRGAERLGDISDGDQCQSMDEGR